MARARKISSDLIHDEEFNCLSIAAQLAFVRLLAVSDDCGVVPTSEHTLNVLIAPPKGLKPQECIDEIVKAGLGQRVQYQGKPYFLFKQSSFRHHQSYIFNKRKQSEYLKISSSEFDEINWSSYDDHMPANCGAMAGIRYKVKGEVKEKKKGEAEKITDYPERLRSERFVKAFSEFREHRKQIKKPLTALAEKKLLDRLAKSPSEAVAMIEQSIENGWQGVFELKTHGHSAARSSPPKPSDKRVNQYECRDCGKTHVVGSAAEKTCIDSVYEKVKKSGSPKDVIDALASALTTKRAPVENPHRCKKCGEVHSPRFVCSNSTVVGG